MKKYSLLFISFLIVLNSCQDSSSIKNKFENIFKDKSVIKEEDSQKIKVRKTYFENGNIKTEISALNNKKHGLAKKYYISGELHTQIHYKNGVKEGEAIWFYKNGKPYRVSQYENGNLEGIRKTYYDDGTLQAEIPYKDDKAIEGLKEYNKRGKLITNYPKIIFETKNSLAINKKIILICKISNKTKNVKFFNEVLVNSEKRMVELQTIKGIAKMEFHIPANSTFDKHFIIHAEVKTSLGNAYRTKKEYNLKIDTR